MSDTIPQGIPRCAINLLARPEWFADPSVVYRVKLAPANWLARLISDPRVNNSSVSAITLGRTIYYRELDRFDPHTPEGLALLAHEIKHVEQYEQDRLVMFNFNYVWAFLRKGYGKNIPYEAVAYALQNTVVEHLRREFAANTGLASCQEKAPPHTPNLAFVKSRPGRFHIPV
jgi:hypothetical protein